MLKMYNYLLNELSTFRICRMVLRDDLTNAELHPSSDKIQLTQGWKVVDLTRRKYRYITTKGINVSCR